MNDEIKKLKEENAELKKLLALAIDDMNKANESGKIVDTYLNDVIKYDLTNACYKRMSNLIHSITNWDNYFEINEYLKNISGTE